MFTVYLLGLLFAVNKLIKRVCMTLYQIKRWVGPKSASIHILFTLKN